MNLNNILKQLYLLGNEIHQNQSLKKYLHFGTWWNVPYFLIPKTEKSFIDTLIVLKNNNINFKILWNWTNIIAADKRFDFWIINTQYLTEVEFITTNQIYIQTWINLSKIIYKLAEKWLWGWESLAWIPGTIWGAIYMNAWAYGWQIQDFIIKVKVFDLLDFKIKWLDKKNCNFGYRKSIFQTNKNLIILGAIFKLYSNNIDNILKKIYLYNEKRRDKQPILLPSAGSMFKRPKPDFYVWTTIEKLWLKWFKIGNIQISEKHAGFVINLWNGKFNDVKKIINIIKSKIRKIYNIDLQTEPEFWE